MLICKIDFQIAPPQDEGHAPRCRGGYREPTACSSSIRLHSQRIRLGAGLHRRCDLVGAHSAERERDLSGYPNWTVTSAGRQAGVRRTARGHAWGCGASPFGLATARVRHLISTGAAVARRFDRLACRPIVDRRILMADHRARARYAAAESQIRLELEC